MTAALLGLGAGCSRTPLQPGEARLTVHGRALLDGRRFSGTRTLHRGQSVSLATGSAVMDLPDGAQLELRPGTAVSLRAQPTLDEGDLLVTSGRRPLGVSTGGASVDVDGVARISRALTVSAASYRGVATLRSAGRDLQVHSPRQASMAALGVLPPRPAPIFYDPGSAWDRRFLGDAVALGDSLANPVEPFTRSLPRGEGHSPGFFRVLLPALDRQPEFGAGLLDPQRSPGETLVGAVIALAAKDGSFADRWRRAFQFRGEGAHWGLVAYDQSVTSADGVVKTLSEALDRAPLDFAAPAASAPTTTTTAAPAPRIGSTTTTTVAVGGGSQPPRPSGPVQPPPSTGTPLDPVVQPLVDTINGLLGALP
jgi:hypothetical protein